MKRKKFYSMLAFGMAVTLAAGVPVSAATSITTSDFGDANVSEVETGEANPDVEQDVFLGKDGDKVVAVIIPESGDASTVIENHISNSTITGYYDSETQIKGDDVDPDKVDLSTADVDYEAEAQTKFEAIAADKIMINIPGKRVTVKTVKPAEQFAAEKAADKMAAAFGLDFKELMASADIHIPLDANESVKVTIPMAAGALDMNYKYFVLHYNAAANAWETVDAQVTEEGIVIASFDSLSPVFVVKAGVKDPVDGSDSGEDNGGDSESSDSGYSGNTASPQKATPAPAVNEPVNPAVSPKTGE